MQTANHAGDPGNQGGNSISRLSRIDFPKFEGMMYRVGFINVNNFLRWMPLWKIRRLKLSQHICAEGH